MNDTMLNLAQEEYNRQYDIWLRQKPDKDDFYNSVEKMLEYFKKYEN